MSDALEQFLNKNSDRAKKWQRVIEGMLNSDGDYDYAEETLGGILEYIEENDTITDAQIQAVENIQDKPSSSYGRRY